MTVRIGQERIGVALLFGKGCIITISSKYILPLIIPLSTNIILLCIASYSSEYCCGEGGGVVLYWVDLIQHKLGRLRREQCLNLYSNSLTEKCDCTINVQSTFVSPGISVLSCLVLFPVGPLSGWSSLTPGIKVK